jgi:diacylglycerol kinase
MNRNFLIKRFKSFKYAFAGLSGGLRNQPNLLIHFAAAVFAVAVSFYLDISRMELCVVIICIALVIALELVNTAIELLCDFVHKDLHERIKHIKDISAAAVLIASIGALVVGSIIFVPYIITLLK